MVIHHIIGTGTNILNCVCSAEEQFDVGRNADSFSGNPARLHAAGIANQEGTAGALPEQQKQRLQDTGR